MTQLCAQMTNMLTLAFLNNSGVRIDCPPPPSSIALSQLPPNPATELAPVSLNTDAAPGTRETSKITRKSRASRLWSFLTEHSHTKKTKGYDWIMRSPSFPSQFYIYLIKIPVKEMPMRPHTTNYIPSSTPSSINSPPLFRLLHTLRVDLHDHKGQALIYCLAIDNSGPSSTIRGVTGLRSVSDPFTNAPRGI